VTVTSSYASIPYQPYHDKQNTKSVTAATRRSIASRHVQRLSNNEKLLTVKSSNTVSHRAASRVDNMIFWVSKQVMRTESIVGAIEVPKNRYSPSLPILLVEKVHAQR